MIGSDLLSENNKLCKDSDLDATGMLKELQSDFAETPRIYKKQLKSGTFNDWMYIAMKMNLDHKNMNVYFWHYIKF